ncbi:MAG: ATP-binding cassette domain-containing protein [Acidimicrobiia bacterium]|nr:ATP-binding cassette domain-containing protein [Acidimicrobiia bacterium]
MTGELLSLHGRIRRGRFTREIDLDVEAGHTVLVTGPNGVGKTTLLHTIAGLTPLADGELSLRGRVVDDADAIFEPPEHRHIGYVFQQPRLFGHLTVARNVAFGADRHLDRATTRMVAATWLDAVDMAAFGDVHPDELSGGQAQRVALARALASDPDVVLLDEPLSNVDAATADDLRPMLAELEQTVVWVTHDVDTTAVHADRVIELWLSDHHEKAF